MHDNVFFIPSLDDYRRKDRPHWMPITAWSDKIAFYLQLRAGGGKLISDSDGYRELAERICDYIAPMISEDSPFFLEQWEIERKYAIMDGVVSEDDEFRYSVDDFLVHLLKTLRHDFSNTSYKIYMHCKHSLGMSDEEIAEIVREQKEHGIDPFGEIRFRK